MEWRFEAWKDGRACQKQWKENASIFHYPRRLKTKEMCNLAKEYSKWIEMEMKKTKTEMVVSTVGKPDPKRHLQSVKIIW